MNLIGNDPNGIKNQGLQTDSIVLPYLKGRSTNSIFSFLNNAYDHVHGESFVYPDHASAIVLTSSAAAWSETGAIVEVIPAGALLRDFDIHWINIAAISTNAEIQIDIFTGASGSEFRVAATRSQRNTNQSRENANRIQTPQISAGTRISCRLSDSSSGAITAAVSFEGHYYAA